MSINNAKTVRNNNSIFFPSFFASVKNNYGSQNTKGLIPRPISMILSVQKIVFNKLDHDTAPSGHAW